MSYLDASLFRTKFDIMAEVEKQTMVGTALVVEIEYPLMAPLASLHICP